MNGIQCPECGSAEVPDQASSCPDCGYPILTLSGFSIRERLREVAPEQGAKTKETQPKAQGRGKGTQLKAKLSRAKNALSKKGKRKPSLEEILLPQISDLPLEEKELNTEDVSELPIVDAQNLEALANPELEEQPTPETPEEKSEGVLVQETLEAAETEVQAESESLSPDLSQQETFDEPLEAQEKEPPIDEPQASAERIGLPEEQAQAKSASVEELMAVPERESVDPEPVAELENVEAVLEDNERPESTTLAPGTDFQNEPSPLAGLRPSTSDTSQSADASQCYECGMEVDQNANFCPYCRASLLRRYCPGCRRLVAGNTGFCAYCGTPATSLAEPPRNFATVLAVLIIVFTAVVIFLAKDFIFEDPALDQNLAKIKAEKSPAQVPEPTNVVTPKPGVNSSQVKKVEEQPGGTTEARPNKDGLVEITIGQDGSVKQDQIQQEPLQVPQNGNQPQQLQQKPAPVAAAPKGNAQPATTEPSGGLKDVRIAGVPSYKNRDPSLARYLNSVGFRLIRQRRYDEAVPILKKSVSYFPDNTKDIVYAYALFNLGHALRMSGRAHEAIPVLEARMKINNQRETVRRELAAARVAALGAPVR